MGSRPEGGAAMSFGASRHIFDLTRAGESGDQAVLLGSKLSLPVAWLDTYGCRRLGRPLEKIFACRTPQAGAPQGFLALAVCRQKFFAFGRVPRALALCPRLAASAGFRRSGRYGQS